jgi:archaellum component FlaC
MPVKRGGVEAGAPVVERCGEGDESSVLYDLEGSSTLRGLEEKVGSLAREKRDLLALRERLELEAREKAEVRRRSPEALKGEVADLRRQVEELKARLKAMQ